MNIYLVERTDDPSWDDVHSMVVAARSPSEARILKPRPDWRGPWGDNVPVLDDLKVTKLGTSERKTPAVLHVHDQPS